MKKFIFCLVCLITFSAQSQIIKNITFVDPFIGTGGHGHTYPGATVPYGMVQLSPDTRIDASWDGCSGYHQSDSVIYGFTHTHLSGTGCSEFGDILFMPMTGTPSVDNKKYSCTFSHKNESASPGYYSVKLNNGVFVELTATTRVGFHKYTFPKAETANIILDLTHRDKTLESSLHIIDKNHIEGMRRSEGWAANQYIYFVAEFSKPFDSYGISSDDKMDNNALDATGTNINAFFKFKNKANESIDVKVSISLVSTDGAHKNMLSELNHWDFKKVRKDAETLWNKELEKIDITGATAEQKKIFYTALYHVMLQPNVNMDADGQYRGRDNKIHTADGFTYYSVFSLWDTFRAAHPLYTLIDRKRTLDFIKTFLAQYEQGGRLPVWELASNETDCMIGYHSVSVIADAFIKGIKDFDTNEAFEAMKKSATWKMRGLPAYIDHGYLEMEDESESVSKMLEYAYDDWCIAQMAKALGKTDDYETYIKRAQYYKNIFDPETGFVRPKKNGGWFSPFEPREVNNNFTEANSWQYTFFVPQDISGLAELMGGTAKLEEKLDELFTTTSITTGRCQPDIAGLIGQYAHGNEPSHHMAYLYDYVGKPWKTQKRVHRILTQLYQAKPDGLIGNEDCGQMSAWYVLSAMGIYEVTPGNPVFAIGTPLLGEVKINLENGKTFIIKTNKVSPTNFYIQSATFNGNPYNKSFISYDEIMKGGNLIFEMSDKPELTWGSGSNDFPSTSITDNKIVEVPVITAASKSFKDKQEISIKTIQKGCKLYYTTDGTEPGTYSRAYITPFAISSACSIKAIAVNSQGEKSLVTTARFYKRVYDRTIQIFSKYSPQYTAGGDDGIIDGIRGDLDWRKGDWQGYQGQDFEAIVDLDKEEDVTEIAAGFLQDVTSWIMMPKKVEIQTSLDGKTFTDFGTVDNVISDKDYKVQVKDFGVTKKYPVKARYVRVKAYNYGKLPAWHRGAGGDAHIFIDEIIID